MADLAEVARELYALAPDAFTATRNERAARARADGDKKLAASIRSLQKPSTAAWALNLLVRERSDEIGQALGLGQTLRAAQAHLDSDALRTLSRQRRALVAALGKQAAALATASGHRISEAAVAEIEQTLNAAMADARAAAALKTARLTRPLDSVGLEPVDLTGAVAAAEEALFDSVVADAAAQDAAAQDATADAVTRDTGERGAAAVGRNRKRSPARTGPSKHQLAEARQKATDAARRADDAAAALEAITRRIERATRQRDRLTAELTDLKSQMATLESAISAAGREVNQLEREHDKAGRAAEAAQAGADRAQKRLDALK
jgi:DNA repair exonuclease SbcCD ATPase subunit